MSVPRRTLLALAAFLSGAAGLGLETLLVAASGAALGYGRSTAVGLGAWIAAWSLGAWWAGRRATRSRVLLALAGIGVLAAGLAAPRLVLLAGRPGAGAVGAGTLALVAIAATALPQGLVLPCLARAWHPGGAREVGPLVAASLAGCVVGAQVFGDALPGRLGRPAAAALAGLAGLVGAGIGSLTARNAPTGPPAADAPVHARDPGRLLTPARAGLLAGLGAGWAVGLEWIGLRLGTLWLGGMQPALVAVLSASLVALAAGAALLPPLLPRDARGVAAWLVLALAGSAWPAHLGPWLATTALESGPLVAAAALVGPALLPFGALVPLLHRAQSGERDGAQRLGDLLLHEAWGAVAVVPLVQFAVVPAVGLRGALVGLLGLGAGMGALVAPAAGRVALAASALGALAALDVARRAPPALASPRLSDPAFTRLAFTEDASFAVTVVDDGVRAERVLLTDDFRASSTGDDYLYMRVLGHLPVLLHAAPRRVAVLAFGTGTTAGAVSLHREVERLDVLELSRAVCEQAPFFASSNHGVLDEGFPGLLDADDDAGRVVVLLGDGRATLARAPGRYDVVTMEPLLPDSPFAVYLYTAEFYALVRAALAPGGLVCQWVPPHALEPSVFDAVVGTFAEAFPWSGVFLFGTQVLLVGAAAPPELDPQRFAAPLGALAHALAEVGLEGPAGLAARLVTEGGRWPALARPVTDADPWIAYRHRVRGKAVLADLPANLGRLRSLEAEPPPQWSAVVGQDGAARLALVRRLHRAREAFAREQAQRLGVACAPAPDLASAADLRAALLPALDADPEVAVFERGVRFEELRDEGLVALRLGQPALALDRCTAAAARRPERADVHVFVAAAAEMLGEDALALAAAARAQLLCPRIAETPQGRLALGQGLSPAVLARARARLELERE